jgi:two-component system alkaline phosphatase synthesis response regulator PhoP
MAKLLIIGMQSLEAISTKAAIEDMHEVVLFEDISNLIPRVRRLKPDLIIFDKDLNVKGGFEACGALKADPKLAQIPIIVLSSKSEELEQGFANGADDYILKPVQPAELRARCNAKLRLVKNILEKVGILEEGDIQFDVVKRIVTICDQEKSVSIKLSPSEFQLLLLLCKNQGRILRRDEIHRELSKKDPKSTDTRVIDAQISSIRRKSTYLQQNIESIHGVGYRLSL